MADAKPWHISYWQERAVAAESHASDLRRALAASEAARTYVENAVARRDEEIRTLHRMVTRAETDARTLRELLAVAVANIPQNVWSELDYDLRDKWMTALASAGATVPAEADARTLRAALDDLRKIAAESAGVIAAAWLIRWVDAALASAGAATEAGT